MSDHRIEPAAKAWDKDMSGRYVPHEVDELSHEVGVILAAADAADAEQGIHRVKVDDATVEVIAATLGNFYYRGEEFTIRDYMQPARQVLAALTGKAEAAL
ncbi:hypothetical protein [Arthrobacter antioxidans]|uniref:hypothetical protein n=1 Tax=Arthrobacter antioxidans TaxID=2895818 RepID=UPI001FFF1F34|nr:hypothetical protein [Arthrobacter antioxidans]